MRKELSADEICSQPTFLYCLRAWVMSSTTKTLKTGTTDVTQPDLWTAVERVSQYSNSLNKVLRILAMVIRGWKLKSRKENLTTEAVDNATAVDMEAAERLLLLSAMPETSSAQMEGRLTSLNPQKNGPNTVTSGRVGEKCLSKLLGVPFLPILMPKSKSSLAWWCLRRRNLLERVAPELHVST